MTYYITSEDAAGIISTNMILRFFSGNGLEVRMETLLNYTICPTGNLSSLVDFIAKDEQRKQFRDYVQCWLGRSETTYKEEFLIEPLELFIKLYKSSKEKPRLVDKIIQEALR